MIFETTTIVICLTLNAILSCIEMAFVTVSKPHLKKLAAEGDKASARVLNLKNNPERVLSVLQIGITLVGAISAAVGGAGAEESLSPVFQKTFQISEEVAESLAIISVVIPLTFLSVVIGELVPKTLALKFPLRFARLGGFILYYLDLAFAPVVFILELSTRIITKIFFSHLKADSLAIATDSVEIDGLSETHKQYVLNLIEVDQRKAKDIMLPWDKVTKLSIHQHASEVMMVIKESGHTRIPVLDENDMPVGILHAKEFIAEREIALIEWTQLLRNTISIRPDEPILSALKILQTQKSHLAIVTKSGQPLGIVTLEDIFEEVVGEIYDEDDDPRILLSSNSRIRTMNLNKK